MKKLIMYVYNDITTDARVQRAADALALDFDLTLISTQKGKKVEDREYKNILVGGKSSGLLGILKTIWAALRIIRHHNPDVVYCHDYYSAILAHILILTHYTGKIVYDAHELMIPEKGRKDKRLNFFYWFEKRIVKRVDLLVCASMERCEIMVKHYSLNTPPLVIDNISQLYISSDQETKTILDSLNTFFERPGITVVYAGSVTNTRRINELLNTVSALAPKFKLLVVGNGPSLSELRECSDKNHNLVSCFTGGVPYKSLGAILSRCDIGFLYYPVDTLNNIYCASNKIYEYASVGLPMMSNENPTVKNILNLSQIGISTNDFKNGLLSIASDRETYKKNCITFTQENQWSDEAMKLKNVITQIA